MGDSDGENIGLSEGINSKDAGKNYPKEIEAKVLELKKGKRAKKTATTKVQHVLEKLCAVQSEENVGEIEKNIEVLWELLEVTLSTIDELCLLYIKMDDYESKKAMSNEADNFETEINECISNAKTVVKETLLAIKQSKMLVLR
jgi:hypothetical protein